MLISYETLRNINMIQVEILNAVSDVCKHLNIKFFIVHGSLLGTLRNHCFVPGDDDIDIAFFRKDYEMFMREAPGLLGDHYFVQTYRSDPGYPLSFGKIRDGRTTYIVEDARHLKMHHGIYIDVFPIDYCKAGSIGAKLFEFKYKLLNMRIASVFDLHKEPMLKKVVRFGTKFIFPSYDTAIRRREQLLVSCVESGYIRMTGGKVSEQYMPIKWFTNAIEDEFEGVSVFIPGGYDQYLTQIYGDYQSRTLVENKISTEEEIEINAYIVDIENPYTQYDTMRN